MTLKAASDGYYLGEAGGSFNIQTTGSVKVMMWLDNITVKAN